MASLILILSPLFFQDSLRYPPEVRRLTIPQRPALEALFGVGVDLGDSDGDGFLDLFAGTPSLPIGFESAAGAVYVLRGPSFAFSERLTQNPIDDFSYFGFVVAVGDVDGDSLAEVAVSWPSNGEVRRGDDRRLALSTFRGGGTGESDHLLFRDVDQDGYQDLIEARLFSPGELSIYYGPDMMRMESVMPANPPAPFRPFNVACGDINADGHLDLVTGTPYVSNHASRDGAAWCFFGPDFAQYQLISDPTPLDDAAFAWGVSVGDYDNDGFDDVATTSQAELCPEAFRCGEAFIFFGPDFTRRLRFRDPFPGQDEISGTYRPATADIDGNGVDDLVISTSIERVMNYRVGSLWVFFGPDLDLWERVTPTNVTLADEGSHFGRTVRVGDVTGDGLDDVLVSAEWWDGYGNGQAGTVHVFDFSTRRPFVTYGNCQGSILTLTGEGEGAPDGSSKLVIEGIENGAVLLLIGEQPCAAPLGQAQNLAGCPTRLLVVPKRAVDLGVGAGRRDYPLRIPSEVGDGHRGKRYRFQVIEMANGALRTSNAVTWTVR